MVVVVVVVGGEGLRGVPVVVAVFVALSLTRRRHTVIGGRRTGQAPVSLRSKRTHEK